ncbi:glycosyltransferase [Rheinheimera sp. UJ63]|uniref:glycosyltransferase n=1 Tax=Rheinheimera sp. UJ63 TaxID=2910157 RepID=UPI001F379031|nr:glycosyltransferase [Rheinheimera sp. UJ63]MCF4007792.1 glycosyltransferase [Rheinheimera sp. UJ63]
MQIHGTEVAFVIPALNEEQNLANTLTVIKQLFGSCEGVILADNGSTDQTVEVAKSFNITTTVHPGVSIAALRNHGVAMTQADIIVFIDSDIQLDPSWPKHFAHTVQQIKASPLTVAGSRCRAINKNNYVGRYWYNRLSQQQSTNYINSGHLVVSRELFDRIGGFDESLRTGEDYDFSQRALKAGGKIEPDAALIAWHDGYPDTIGGFMAREMWHGRDEFKSITSIFQSKVALVSVTLTLSLAVALVLSVQQSSLLPILWYSGCWALLILTLIIQKFGLSSLKVTTNSALLYYLYFLSRSFAWSFKARRPLARSRQEKPDE